MNYAVNKQTITQKIHKGSLLTKISPNGLLLSKHNFWTPPRQPEGGCPFKLLPTIPSLAWKARNCTHISQLSKKILWRHQNWYHKDQTIQDWFLHDSAIVGSQYKEPKQKRYTKQIAKRNQIKIRKHGQSRQNQEEMSVVH